MTAINMLEYKKAFMTAIDAVLAKYFDGDNHTFVVADVDTSVAFPECEIKFNRQQLGESLEKPVIVTEMFADVNLMRQSSKDGMLRSFKQLTFMRVFTNDEQDIWDINDNVQNLLGLVLDSAADEFADLGLRPVSITQAVPVALDATHRMQVSQRTVGFRVDSIHPKKKV